MPFRLVLTHHLSSFVIVSSCAAFTQEYAPSDDELSVMRRGEEWTEERANEIKRKREVCSLTTVVYSETRSVFYDRAIYHHVNETLDNLSNK